mmetsp:Transcript_69593/g.201690  ORF Transcript_69593/g.201690 Transcript_69593/m.201690 type:complete len:433 (-) Transcript_69593:32-1330(-)
MSVSLSDSGADAGEGSIVPAGAAPPAHYAHDEHDWAPNPYQAVADAQVRAGEWPGASILLEAAGSDPLPPPLQGVVPAPPVPLHQLPQVPVQPPPPTQQASIPGSPAPAATLVRLSAPPCRQHVAWDVDDDDDDDIEDAPADNGKEVQDDEPASVAWGFLFEFSEPKSALLGAGVHGDEITDDTDDDEFDFRGYSEDPEGSGIFSANHTEAASSSSSRSGWILSHRSVPKSTDLHARFGGGSVSSSSTSAGGSTATGGGSAGGITTLMLRHLPNVYTRKMLVEELDFVGLAGMYDFLYLPIDKSTQWNVGYAFVNFVTPAAASKCVGLLTDYVFQRYFHNSGKVTQVAVAHIQGLERNLQYYSKTAVQLGCRYHRPLVCPPKSEGDTSAKGAAKSRRRRRYLRRKSHDAAAAGDGADGGDRAPSGSDTAEGD